MSDTTYIPPDRERVSLEKKFYMDFLQIYASGEMKQSTWRQIFEEFDDTWEAVMKTGSIELSRNFRIVKCPNGWRGPWKWKDYGEAICIVHTSSEGPCSNCTVCSGPFRHTENESAWLNWDKFAGRKITSQKPHSSCPYHIANNDADKDELFNWLLDTLVDNMDEYVQMDSYDDY